MAKAVIKLRSRHRNTLVVMLTLLICLCLTVLITDTDHGIVLSGDRTSLLPNNNNPTTSSTNRAISHCIHAIGHPTERSQRDHEQPALSMPSVRQGAANGNHHHQKRTLQMLEINRIFHPYRTTSDIRKGGRVHVPTTRSPRRHCRPEFLSPG